MGWSSERESGGGRGEGTGEEEEKGEDRDEKRLGEDWQRSWRKEKERAAAAGDSLASQR